MSRNGHDKVAADDAEMIEKIMKRKHAPDEIIKDGHYMVGLKVKALKPLYGDTRGRIWAEEPRRFVRYYDIVWNFPE